MKDFISEIRKIETDKVLSWMSMTSIEMMRKNQYVKLVDVPVIRYGKMQVNKVPLTAWDILDIAYLSVKYSNDYRSDDKSVSFEQLAVLYRKYENEHSVAEDLEDASFEKVNRIILGMTAEQFQYQNWSWISEKLNREYYILIVASDFENRNEIDASAVVKEVFGYSVDDYLSMVVWVIFLCMQHPAPMAYYENLQKHSADVTFTYDNLKNFIDYYSCSYDDLRSNPIGKQLLYSKPFIKTQRHENYLAVSIFPVLMILGNGLYWLVRDYYHKQNNERFLHAFGTLFEDYIAYLAKCYCISNEWEKIPASSYQKEADFIFDFGKFKMLVESKSSLLMLSARQQVPELGAIDRFFKNTVEKAYQQLNSSYDRLKNSSKVPIIKVVLLYDNFSNTAITELSMPGVFENDYLCFVMTIRDLEMLLYYHCNDKVTEQKIIDRVLAAIDSKMKINIGAIYNELSLYENLHFKGEWNYFKRKMERIVDNIR